MVEYETTYTITFNQDEYVTLLRLTMLYGTGISADSRMGTSVVFREKISNPKRNTAVKEETA